MTRTQHFNLRCKQRRISPEEILMAVRFGYRSQDRSLLGAKNCETLLRAIDYWERQLRTGSSANGLNLVKAHR